MANLIANAAFYISATRVSPLAWISLARYSLEAASGAKGSGERGGRGVAAYSCAAGVIDCLPTRYSAASAGVISDLSFSSLTLSRRESPHEKGVSGIRRFRERLSLCLPRIYLPLQQRVCKSVCARGYEERGDARARHRDRMYHRMIYYRSLPSTEPFRIRPHPAPASRFYLIYTSLSTATRCSSYL